MNLHFFQSAAHRLSNLIWAKTSLAADIHSAIEQLERKLIQKELEVRALSAEANGIAAQLDYLRDEQSKHKDEESRNWLSWADEVNTPNVQNSLHNPS